MFTLPPRHPDDLVPWIVCMIRIQYIGHIHRHTHIDSREKQSYPLAASLMICGNQTDTRYIAGIKTATLAKKLHFMLLFLFVYKTLHVYPGER